MSILKVPQRFRKPLIDLAITDESIVTNLINVLVAENQTVFGDDVVSRIATKIAGDSEFIRNLVAALISLYLTKTSTNKSPQEIANDVADGISQKFNSASDSSVALSDEYRTAFIDRLTRLLSVSTFDTAARASGVLREYGSIFSDSRVLSDIRPIFNSNSMPESIQGALIVHSLRISYFDGNDSKTSFFTLDSEDLSALKICVERAIAKESLLRKELESKSIPVLTKSGD